MIVARLGHAIVGYAFGANDASRTNAYRLEKIVVRPDFRRRGVGRELVAAMRRQAFAGLLSKDLIGRRLIGECSELNIAGLCLLRACGFRFGRLIPDAYDKGEASVLQVWRPSFVDGVA